MCVHVCVCVCVCIGVCRRVCMCVSVRVCGGGLLGVILGCGGRGEGDKCEYK